MDQDIIRTLTEAIDALYEHQEKVDAHQAALRAENAALRFRVGSLEDDIATLKQSSELQPKLPNMKLPPPDQISNIKVQIFHNSEVSGKRKSEWSLRLTVWIGGIRCADEIKYVELFPRERFAANLQRMEGAIPEKTQHYADNLSDSCWVGMIRTKTYQQGSPYQRDQVCILYGHHLTDDSSPPDDLQVAICNAGSELVIREWRISAGERGGKSLWWGETGAASLS